MPSRNRLGGNPSVKAGLNSRRCSSVRYVLPHLVAWSRMAPLFVFLLKIASILGYLVATTTWQILLISEATCLSFNPSRIASCNVWAVHCICVIVLNSESYLKAKLISSSNVEMPSSSSSFLATTVMESSDNF